MRYGFACVQVSSKCICKGRVKAIFSWIWEPRCGNGRGLSKCKWIVSLNHYKYVPVQYVWRKKIWICLEIRKLLQEKLKIYSKKQNKSCLCSSQFRKVFLKLKFFQLLTEAEFFDALLTNKKKPKTKPVMARTQKWTQMRGSQKKTE